MKANAQDFELDEYNLEEETSKQSNLTYKYGAMYAEAKAKRDRYKIRLEVVRAEVSRHIRDNHDEYGLRAPNEGAIKLETEADERVVKYKKKVNAAQEECDLAFAAVNAINAKKEAINGQIRLYAMHYYSDKPIHESTTKKSGPVTRRKRK